MVTIHKHQPYSYLYVESSSELNSENGYLLMQPLLPWLLALACVCWLTWAEEVGCRRSSSALYTESMGELLHKSIVYVHVCANVCIICRQHG